MRPYPLPLLAGMALAFLAVIVLSQGLAFVQDDAYITLVYARNLVEGNGLSFVPGETVEGFTSPLWMLLSSALLTLTSNPVPVLQWLGILSVGCSAALTVHTAWKLIPMMESSGRRAALATLCGLWPATLPAALYWSTSAMETGAFLVVTTAFVSSWLQDRTSVSVRLLSVILVLLRPEAMLVVPFLMGASVLLAATPDERRAAWRAAAVPGSTLLALTVGRLMVFDALLPNTFSAKTHSLGTQIADGWDYLQLFVLHASAWGLLPLLALAAWFSRNGAVRTVLSLAITWTLAVVILGGDVLRHQRFLLPIVVITAPFIGLGVVELNRRVKLPAIAMLAACCALIGAAALSERDGIQRTRTMEGELVSKMARTGDYLRTMAQAQGKQLTIAASTIGALAWTSRLPVVDMLGLTDKTIATNPDPIPAISNDATVGWKERKYNARYVLSRRPDVIVFSTGMKPSSYAERALFAEQFYCDYYQYYYPIEGTSTLQILYRRKPDAVLRKNPQQPLASIDLAFIPRYVEALNLLTNRRTTARAHELFQDLASNGPTNFTGAHQQLSDLEQSNVEGIERYASEAIRRDPCDVRSHFDLFQVARFKRDTAAMALHGDWVSRCNPKLFTLLGISVPDDKY